MRDPAPNVLRLQIPVERDPTRPPIAGAAAAAQSPFQVYMRLRVSQPGRQEPLTVGEFPFEAPADARCPASQVAGQ
jgi:hypothetical protein